MNEQKAPQPDDRSSHARYFGYAAVFVLAIAGYFVLFQPGFGVLESARAQVNPVRIGESVAETITEHGGASSLDTAAEQMAEEAVREQEAEGIPGIEIPEELPPGESAEAAQVSIAGGVELPTYYISYEGLGGQDFRDMEDEELREALMLVPEVRGEARIADLMMPILRRFQVMTSPPTPDPVGDEVPAWDSGMRRYSPFDALGRDGGTIPGPIHSIPPFPPLDLGEGPVSPDEPTAGQVARMLTIVGIIGEPGNYRAIIAGGGQQRLFQVGDVVEATERTSFVVEEITMSAVVIANETRSGDRAPILFTESDPGISGISISFY